MNGGGAVHNAVVNIDAAAGGLVALYDPMMTSLQDGKTFSMNVRGSGGDFHWGGLNNFFTGGETGKSVVTFESGSRTTLMPDFQVQGSNLNVDIRQNASVTMDLTDRDAWSAMFLTPQSFTAEGVQLTPTLNTLERVSSKYLITDKAGTAQADAFTLQENSLDASVVREGDRLYLRVGNSGIVDDLENNDSGSVSDAMASDALQTAWENTRKALSGNQSLIDAAFRELTSNPQHYIAELATAGAFGAMSFMNNANSGALGLNQSSAAVAAASPVASGSGLASLRAGYCRQPLRLWAGYVGSHTDQDNDGSAYGYHTNLHGAVFGASYDFSNAVTTGLYFSYAAGRTNASDLNARTDIDAYGGGLFASLKPVDRLTLDLDASFGHFDNTLNRHNLLGSYRADYDQSVYGAGAKASYDFEFASAARVSPYLEARYQHLRQDSFSETGAPMGNTVDKMDADSFTTALGVKLSRDFCFADGRKVTPGIYAAWRHEYADRQFNAAARFNNTPQTFLMQSVRRQRDSADIGAAIKAELYKSDSATVDLDLGYDVNLTKKYASHQWRAMVGVAF